MGLTIPTGSLLQLIDIGLTPRYMKDSAPFDLKLTEFEKEDNNHAIQMDEQGEYTFTKNSLVFDRPHKKTAVGMWSLKPVRV